MQWQVATEPSRCEVAHVLEKLGNKVENLGLNTWQLRTLSAVRRCRTAALGGHIDACDNCGKISISYNSCRNRHCPKCPCCKTGNLHRIAVFDQRGPPTWYLGTSQNTIACES